MLRLPEPMGGKARTEVEQMVNWNNRFTDLKRTCRGRRIQGQVVGGNAKKSWTLLEKSPKMWEGASTDCYGGFQYRAKSSGLDRTNLGLLPLLPRSPLPLPLNTTTDWHFTAITVRRKPTHGLELERKQLHGTSCIKESKVSISKTEPKTYLARIEYFLFILETFVER